MRVEYAYRFRLYPETSKKKFENKLLLRLKKEYLSNTKSLQETVKNLDRAYKNSFKGKSVFRLETIQAKACGNRSVSGLLRKQIGNIKVAVSISEQSTIHLAVNQEIFLKLASFQSKLVPQFIGEYFTE